MKPKIDIATEVNLEKVTDNGVKKVTVPESVKRGERGQRPSDMLKQKDKDEDREKASLEDMLADHELIDTTSVTDLKMRGLAEFAALKDDPKTNLLGDRWLERGCLNVICAPSGVGKSSTSYQCAALWSLGRPAFGITPQKPLRVLIFQAEDSDLDIRDPVAGILDEPGHQITDEDIRLINDRVKVVTTHESGFTFIKKVLLPSIKAHTSDLAILNPILAFKDKDVDLGKQAEAATYIRQELIAIAASMSLGFVGIHHTNKPGNIDWEKRNEYDLQYILSGSADVTNAARGVLVILPQSGGVFKFVGAKRGNRLGWFKPSNSHENDEEGQNMVSTTTAFYSYKRIGKGYVWVPTGKEDIESAVAAKTAKKRPGRQKDEAKGADAVLALMGDKAWGVSGLQEEAERVKVCGKTLFYKHWAWLKLADKVVENRGLWLVRESGSRANLENNREPGQSRT